MPKSLANFFAKFLGGFLYRLSIYVNEHWRFWVLWFIILNNLAWLVWAAYYFFDFRIPLLY